MLVNSVQMEHAKFLEHALLVHTTATAQSIKQNHHARSSLKENANGAHPHARVLQIAAHQSLIQLKMPRLTHLEHMCLHHLQMPSPQPFFHWELIVHNT